VRGHGQVQRREAFCIALRSEGLLLGEQRAQLGLVARDYVAQQGIAFLRGAEVR
jgi:hypothetical protein